MFYRRHIHSICNGRAHLFPVRMQYRGRQMLDGLLVHVMQCPACRRRRYYIYCGSKIIRVFRHRAA